MKAAGCLICWSPEIRPGRAWCGAAVIARADDLAFMARSIGVASITEPGSTHPGYEERLAAMTAHDDVIEKQPPTTEVSSRVSFRYNRSGNLLTLTPQQR